MDVKEYNYCVKTYSDDLYRYMIKMGIRVDLAQDIVQNAFIKLWKNFEGLELEKAKSWLYTTTYRTMIDELRVQKREKEKQEMVEPEWFTENHRTENTELIELALGTLNEDEKNAIILRDYDGYSYEEITEITGYSLSKIKTLIFRGRKKLATNSDLKAIYLQ